MIMMGRKKESQTNEEVTLQQSDEILQIRQEIENSVKQLSPEQLITKTRDNILRTGYVLYDEVIGGIPLGQIISIQSLPGVGKTTLQINLQQSLLQVQNKSNKKQMLIYFDTEQQMSYRRMQQLGLNINSQESQSNVIYLQPQDLESTYGIILKTLKQHYETKSDVSLVYLFDSLSQTLQREELQEENIESVVKKMQVKQRVNSKQIPVILKSLSLQNQSLIIINQLRKTMNTSFFSGQDEDITGGLQIKYYQTQDIRMVQGGQKELEKFDINGRIVRLKQSKNRVQPPLIEIPMVLDYSPKSRGFSNQLSIFVFLSNLTKQEWSEQKLDPNMFKSQGRFWKTYNLKTNEEFSFTQKEFQYKYQTDLNFRDQINILQITIIRRLYMQQDSNYIFDPEIEPIYVQEDFYSQPLSEQTVDEIDKELDQSEQQEKDDMFETKNDEKF